MPNRTSILRSISLWLNGIAVVGFGVFLAYTFFAREHVNELARGYVTEKTVHYAQPILDEVADQAEQTLASPLVRAILTDRLEITIREEIKKYRHDVRGYITDLTRHRDKIPAVADRHPVIDKVLAPVNAAKERIRAYYDETLSALITDLRIFGLSNFLAAAIAAGMIWYRRPVLRGSVVWFSCLMFGAMVYHSLLYVDNLTFFRILMQSHAGWWYPVFLALTIVGLICDYGHFGEMLLPDEELAIESKTAKQTVKV